MERGSSQRPIGTIFLWSVIFPVLAGLALLAYVDKRALARPGVGGAADLILWILVVAAVGLFPVPVSPRLHLNLNYPILLAVVVLYHSPVVAGLVGLIGSTDPREVRGQITIPKALFNRSQYALSLLAASAVFHFLASIRSPWYVVAPSVLLATAVDYLVNVTMVTVAMHLLYGPSFREVLGQLRLGVLPEFLLNYLGLGFVGVVIAELFLAVGMWSVVAFILPLVFARQMFFRNLALEEASRELKDRERVLRALSNRMAEERQDERMQIAAYLHDDLAQMLFRLTLQVEMAKKRLAQGDLPAVQHDLDGITGTKQETSDMVRALIRDLHRSPIGRKGLAEAIQSLAEDMSRGGPTRVDTDVVEVSLPPPIQLLIYQIAREAAMNALKHAEASAINITLAETADGVELKIRDDGNGFDTTASPPEGHFGTVMMRERALVAGGTYSVTSELGRGTTISATFPRVWVEEGSLLESDEGRASQSTSSLLRTPAFGTTAGPRPPVSSGDQTPPKEKEPQPAKLAEAVPVKEEGQAGRTGREMHPGSDRRAVSA